MIGGFDLGIVNESVEFPHLRFFERFFFLPEADLRRWFPNWTRVGHVWGKECFKHCVANIVMCADIQSSIRKSVRSAQESADSRRYGGGYGGGVGELLAVQDEDLQPS